MNSLAASVLILLSVAIGIHVGYFGALHAHREQLIVCHRPEGK
jgi:hypothetical protein